MDLGREDALGWQLDEAQRLTHVGSWVWEAATNRQVWSDELYRIVGLPVGSTLAPDTYVRTIHPDDRARVESHVSAALASGQRFTIRVRIVRPDGVQREVEMIGEPTFDAAKTITGLIGTSRDLSDELRREDTIRLFTDVVDGLAIGLSVWQLDAHGEARLIASNPANDRLVGISVPKYEGAALSTCFPRPAATEIAALLRGVTDGRRELPAWRLGPQVFAAKAFALPDHRVGLSLEDVTQRVRDQRLHFGERRILEMLAAAHPLGDILATITQLIEELVPDTLASILLLDPTTRKMYTGAAPSLPLAFSDIVDGLEIGPAAGSCGTAAYRRDAVLVEDIERDPLWKNYRDAVRPFGLRACFSLPILANDGRVLGTFGMYYRTVRTPDRLAMEVCERAVHVAGIAIERRRLDERLQAALLARTESSQNGDVDNIRRRVE